MDKLQVAPIRKLDDFLLSTSSRFSIPDFGNLPKWNHRMQSNVLYYQTNYMISIILIFVMIALWNPSSLLLGFFSLATATAVFLYLKANKPSVDSFQQQHPSLTVVVIFFAGYSLVWMFDCVAVFLFATVAPIMLMLIHASCRQRAFANKVNEKLETLGLKRTPAGIVLEYLGQELAKLE